MAYRFADTREGYPVHLVIGCAGSTHIYQEGVLEMELRCLNCDSPIQVPKDQGRRNFKKKPGVTELKCSFCKKKFRYFIR